MEGFSISDVVERTGVADGTLRMWERRHGFPLPERLPSGHRRYSERDVELVLRVASERAAGISLPIAIERARGAPAPPVASIYAALRRRRPQLEPRVLPKRVLLALSRAIEEESLSRAERPLLFASFQRECYYRQEEARWRELSRSAQLSLAFADFERLRAPCNGPTEIPVRREDPLSREWAIVCDCDGHAVCLAAWEPTLSTTAPTSQRFFESVWSVEPDAVRDAARICAEIAAEQQPSLIDDVRGRLAASPALPTHDQLRLATAITNRALSYLA